MKAPGNALPSGPMLIIDEPDFRLVRVFIGDHIEHVLEVKEGVDAMGAERWRRFETRGSKNLEAMFVYFTRLAARLHDGEWPKLKEQTDAKH